VARRYHRFGKIAATAAEGGGGEDVVNSPRIGVIGAGYVGLTTAVVLAGFGFPVLVTEKNPERLRVLQSGRTPIYEPGLDDLFTEALQSGTLRFTGRLEEVVTASDVVFIAVGTPSDTDGSADLAAVLGVADAIAGALSHRTVIVMKSTVPIGTCDAVSDRIARVLETRAAQKGGSRVPPHEGVDELFTVVSCPEFLREGKAVLDLVHPHRIVIGTDSAYALELLRDLFRPIDAPTLVTDRRSAEAIKYASNAFLATKIGFINEMANLCEATGADIVSVANGMGLDDRIGDKFLQAGVGYGGSCFPKDTRALLRIAQDVGYDFAILRATIDVNERQKLRVVHILEEMLGDLKGRRVALLGLAFKPETDDTREAPSIVVAQALLQKGACVTGYDPKAAEQFAAEVPEVVLASTPEEALRGADACALLTEWQAFTELDLSALRKWMKGDVLIDGRNALDAQAAQRAGFRYRGIGRPMATNRNEGEESCCQ
jgi:UDPglucose 6-dehydrogenase